MKPSNRTIVFLARSLERSHSEVLLLRKELVEAMRQNAELIEQAKVYESEIQSRERAMKLVVAAGTTADMRRKLQAVFDAAMGEK